MQAKQANPAGKKACNAGQASGKQLLMLLLEFGAAALLVRSDTWIKLIMPTTYSTQVVT